MKIKSTKKEKLFAVLASVALSVLAIASYIFNMGWIRVLLTFVLFPIFHIVAIFITNILTTKYFKFSKAVKIYNIVYNVSFALFYVFLPDAGDIGESYIFFGLIKNSELATVCGYLAELFAVVHIVFFILLIVKAVKIKKQ